jgi:simple sugar transport system ATP-binding protein
LTALDGVDFDVARGEIHALLGENGAGKSTLMNALSGLLRPTAGEILIDGVPVRFASPSDAERQGIGMVHQHFLLVPFASPSDAERQGIGMVHQHFLLVPPLSVRENLLLGASDRMGGALSYPVAKVVEEAQSIADRLGWRIPWDAPAGSLPVGTQQRVEILKALRGETRVLIFDEPTAVLTPTETPELFSTIRQLAIEGRGIVFISHKLNEVLDLARRVTVLRRGRVVLRTTADATDAAGLAEAMVGTGSEAAEMLALASGESRHHTAIDFGDGVAAGLLSVRNLALNGLPGSPRPLLSDITFDVAPGEVFGIAGVDGNGQAELAECLAGLLRPSAGSIRVAGEIPAANPAAFRHAGVMVIPADRQRRGLALPLTITENLALGVYDKGEFRRGPILLWPRLRERADGLIRRFDVRTTGSDVPVRALSGGNQQKVVVARALADAPRVVVAVNPTRGLDVGAIAYVHDSLRRAQAGGAAIVLISTELEEVLTLADRVAVLYEGRFSGIVPPETPREEIGLLMGGQTLRDDAG